METDDETHGHVAQRLALPWRAGGVLSVLRIPASLAAFCLLAAGMLVPAHAAPAQPRSCGAQTVPPAPSVHNSASAHIHLNTSSATVGTLINVQGSGWPANAEVMVGAADYALQTGLVDAFDQMAQTEAAADGTFTVAFRLRGGTCSVAPQPGTTAQVQARTFDSAVVASTPLAIVQVPSIATSDASSGSSSGSPWHFLPPNPTGLHVTGSNWIPGTRLALVASVDDGERIPADRVEGDHPLPNAQPIQVSADASGAFSADLPLPKGVAPGTNVWALATTQSAAYGDLAVAAAAGLVPLPVAPTLALSFTSGPSGSSLAITGDHWRAGDAVVAEYCRDSARSLGPTGTVCNTGPRGLAGTGYAQELTRTTIDATGHLSAQLTLPANAQPGPITFEVWSAASTSDAELYVQTAHFTVVKASGIPQAAHSPALVPVLSGLVVLALGGLLAWGLVGRRFVAHRRA